jgi:hypothetical protein
MAANGASATSAPRLIATIIVFIEVLPKLVGLVAPNIPELKATGMNCP